MSWMIMIPLFVAELYFLAGCILFKPDKSGQKTGLRRYGILMVPFIPALFQVLLFLLVWLAAKFFTICDGFPVPKAAMVIVSLLTDAVVFAKIWFPKESVLRVIRRLCILCGVLFILEILVFNGKSFTLHPQTELIDSSRMEIEDYSISFRENDYIVIGTNSSIKVEDLPDWTRCVTIQLQNQPNVRPLRVRFNITDENFFEAPQVCGQKMTSTYGRDVEFCIIPYGDLRGISMEFYDVGAPVRLFSISCLSAAPFHFSMLRFIGLLLFFGAILLIHEYKLAYVVYDRRKLSHRLITAGMTVLCMASVLVFRIPNQKLVAYPGEIDMAFADPYTQTVDAFEHGQAWLTVPVAEELPEMEMLYDRVYRDSTGVFYMFDRALYNGKYYSYFGIAPVVTFYYPVYWITGKLPTLAMACMFYSPFVILFLCLSILASVRLCCKTPNFLLLILSMPVSVLLCGVFYSLQFPNLYDVVISSGLCFLSLALWTGMEACLTRKNWLRCLLFAICGTGCVFCVQSRPSMAITAAVLIPFFLGVLRDKSLTVKARTQQVLSFAIPVCIGAAATMYYNAIRFSSPLDFGMAYQLTVSNIGANTLRLSAIPAAVYHYLLQWMAPRPYFPFFTLSYYTLDNYHMYNNMEHTVGALTMPVLAMAMFFLPKVLPSKHRIGGAASVLQSKAFVAGALLMAVVVAWMDFCLGGVSLRYTFDFMPALLMASTVLILCAVKEPRSYIYLLTVVSIITTFILLCLLLPQFFVEGTVDATLSWQHPQWEEILEDVFMFWE